MREDRRRIAIAIALSVLVHATLLLLFWMAPVHPVTPKKTEPVQISLITLPPPVREKVKPAPEEKKEQHAKIEEKKRAEKKQKVAAEERVKEQRAEESSGEQRETEKHRAEAQQKASGQKQQSSGQKSAEQLQANNDAQQRGAQGENPPDGVMLFPKDLPNGVAVPQGEPSHMHVVHNDPSELPSDEAKKAEEEIRVSQRVNGWMSDDLATIKAANGGGDPYVSDLRDALKKGAEHPPPFKSQGNIVSQAVRSYFNAAEQYGKSGTPVAELVPNNDAAHERQQRDQGTFPDGVTRDESVRNGLYMGTTIKSLADGNGNGVLAIVSITQGPDAKLLSVELIAASGDADFDKFVLKVAPEALNQLPPFALGSHPKGLRTEWAFRGKISYRRHLKDMNFKDDAAYTALTLPMTLLGGGSFEETTGDVQVIDFRHAQYECSVKLLRIYE